MSVQRGDKLAHYEIVEPIGKGGMGEVYRARDGKLGRDVAIKVLPEELARDSERLRRFQREAKVLASLNHPNIAAIYGLEHTEDTHYLVLELVPGETLAERIARGPIGVDEALDIAKKIAEALEEAHEQGIVHRDLKPANVKLTPDDKVKVLDFGLAKALVEEAPEADSSMSPTITRDATRVGVILGTAAYMSPEQAKGKQVDKRADIWAFGAVLYEMLTGKRAFYGEDVSDTLAAVLRAEPDWDALPASVPESTSALLRRCLVKNPRERLRDIGDTSLFTETSLATGSLPTPVKVSRLPWVVAAFAIVAAIVATIGSLPGADRREASPTHLSVTLPPEHSLSFDSSSSVTISGDGSTVAFVARSGGSSRLFVRELSTNDVRAVGDTDGAYAPVFSPDAASVIYRRLELGSLQRVALRGGPPVPMGEFSGMGASWADEETLLLGRYPEIGIWRFSVLTRELERLTERGHDFWQYWPHALPRGRGILFTAHKGAAGKDVDVLVSSSGERRVVMRNATSGRYVPTGHLVFARDGTLFAAPFDIDALEVSGDGVPVVLDVAVHRYGGAHYDFSDDGTLVYATSPSTGDDRGHVLVVDRTGDERLLWTGVDFRSGPRLSPDGRFIALSMGMPADIWILDSHRAVTTRFTLGDSAKQAPLWSPDGKWIAFASNRDGAYNVFIKPFETNEPPVALAPSENWQFPSDWSRDGSKLLFVQDGPTTRDDIWVYSMEASSARVWLASEFNESGATFSPDERWIAYVSNESGANEVFIRPADGSGRPTQVSTSGGGEPKWSPSGNELFFRNANRMMAVTVSTDTTLAVGPPVELFGGNYDFVVGQSQSAYYDVGRDGEEFFMIRGPDVAPIREIRVVLNWFEELKQLVPTE